MHHKICRNHHYEAQGGVKGELNESQGAPPGLSPLRKDGSQGGESASLDCMSSGQWGLMWD